MSCSSFDEYFDKVILPKYHTNHHADDYDLQQEGPNPYRIPLEMRLDLTHLRCYSIDPPGCEDPDDAFSIWTDDQQKPGWQCTSRTQQPISHLVASVSRPYCRMG